MARFAIEEAREASALRACRELFVEYQRELGVSLCFQGFERELDGLPGDYAPPRGALWIATVGPRPAGCVALRDLGGGDAEMKRLYVRPEGRGMGLGRALAEAAVERARALGYRGVKLDTLPWLAAALRMYARMGFVETAPYNDNPLAGVRFLALDLSGAAPPDATP